MVKAVTAAGHEALAIGGRSAGGRSVNLLDPDAVGQLLQDEPAWIVHCAAVVDVDWCEAHPTETFALNAEVPRRIAAAAGAAGVRLVHISTDSVFDGDRGRYTEDDEPRPINTYARAKLAAELNVMEASAISVVLRTNMFGAAHRARFSLAEWVLGKLRDGEPFPGFTDVRFSPLYVAALGRTIVQVTESNLTGLFHAGAANGISKFDFARAIATRFDYDAELVEPTTSTNAGWSTPRPRDTTLISSRLAGVLGQHAPTVEDGLTEFAAQLRNASEPGNEESA